MNIDYDKLWKEVNETVKKDYGRKLPHEKTISELSIEWCMGRQRVEEAIQELMKAGKITGREVVSHNGKRSMAYSPIEKTKEP